ncbi:hypothetical protein GVAV_001651 [Gurleya vavrai]
MNGEFSTKAEGDSLLTTHLNTVFYEHLNRTYPQFVVHNSNVPHLFTSFSKFDSGLIFNYEQKNKKPKVTDLNPTNLISEKFSNDYINVIKILISIQAEFKKRNNVTELPFMNQTTIDSDNKNKNFENTKKYLHQIFEKQIVREIAKRSKIPLKFHKLGTQYTFSLRPINLPAFTNSYIPKNTNPDEITNECQDVSMKDLNFELVNIGTNQRPKIYLRYDRNAPLKLKRKKNIQISDILNFFEEISNTDGVKALHFEGHIDKNFKEINDENLIGLVTVFEFLKSNIVIQNLKPCQIEQIYVFDNLLFIIGKDNESLKLYEIIDYNLKHAKTFISKFESRRLNFLKNCNDFALNNCIEIQCCQIFAELAAIDYFLPRVFNNFEIYLSAVNCLIKGKRISVNDFLRFKTQKKN